MKTVPITVTIPVGPYPSNRRWLEECLLSINAQTVAPEEVLLIDDQAGLYDIHGVTIWRTPWRSGVAHAFNFGVGQARNNLVIMLGSDDKLLPRAVEMSWEAWQYYHDPLGYYAFIIKYDNGKVQDTPCNGAMVTKDLWKFTGGFPPESAIGGCDTWLLSLLMIGEGRFGNIYKIGDEPYYWYREHPETDTVEHRKWWGLVEVGREVYLIDKVRELNESLSMAVPGRSR